MTVPSESQPTTPPNQTTWATSAQVATFTSATVTDVDVLRADAVIEVLANRPYSDAIAGRVGWRDQRYMMFACAYQCAWMVANPDLYTRLNITAFGQARSRISLGPDAMTIAPNAAKALSRVSWLKTRSLHIQAPYQDNAGSFGVAATSSASDDLYPWYVTGDDA